MVDYFCPIPHCATRRRPRRSAGRRAPRVSGLRRRRPRCGGAEGRRTGVRTAHDHHVHAACESLASTGLYPYVVREPGVADARQFPKSSGYREDPATGIAAAALFFGLLDGEAPDLQHLEVRQGQAMGRPSRIHVEAAAGTPTTCRVSGLVIRFGDE